MNSLKNDVYVYEYHNALYINPTNRCTNNCHFCIRNDRAGVGGHKLWIEHEPSSKEIIEEIGKHPGFKKITFCGFGEPTIRLDVLKEVSAFAKENNMRVRVNTNGHANAYHGRDVLPELVGLVDMFSISLNTDDPKEYQEECESQYGEKAYDYMLDFAKKSVEYGFETVLSVVDFISEEKINSCRTIADSIGADFRIRHMA